MKSLKQLSTFSLCFVSFLEFVSISLGVGFGWLSRILLWLMLRLTSLLFPFTILRKLSQHSGRSFVQLRSNSYRYADSWRYIVTCSKELSV